MKNTELRINNLVFRAIQFDRDMNPIAYSDVPYCVDAIDFEYITIHDHPHYTGTQEVKISYLKGIELTEEWLNKLGVNKAEKSKYDYWIEEIRGGFYFDGTTFSWEVEDFKVTETLDIKCVHQLQNLFYALTGKELIYE